MTYLTSTLSAQPLSFLQQKISDFFEYRSALISQKRSVRALNQLDNRALKDLAISRSEIYSIVYTKQNDRNRAWAK